jgi:leucyl aminopeptidase (aminopeptidase T)
VLEDEKVLGTAHIAFGNNLSMGGSIDVPLHLDGVLIRPTIEIDGRIVLNKGEIDL